MTEKTKKKLFGPLMLTIMLALVLIVSGFGILGANQFTTAKADVATEETTDETDETVSEDVDETTYESASTQTWTTAGYNYTYTATPGRYKLEVWGAQGGGNSTSSWGGYGGYTYAEFQTNTTVTLYISVGGGGRKYTGANSSATAGEINGGGGLYRGHQGGTGGGATHIATATGALSGLVNNKNAILIVAGGGGGVGCNCATSSSAYCGAGGGGLNAGTSAPTTHHSTNRGGGKGGTTTAAGAGGVGRSGTSYSAGYAGSFGQGGHQMSNYSGSYPRCGGGGGGGGYYGGGSGGSDISCNDYDDGSGGGGSGYVNTGRVVAGTYGGTVGARGQHAQAGLAGQARITPLNSAPQQNTAANTDITLYRNADTTITLEGTNANTSMLGSDNDKNSLGDVVQLNTAGVYMSASTATPANTPSGGNYYLTWTSASVGGTSITVRALRWWSGYKTFYVNVRDWRSSLKASPGGNVWFSFRAKCATGTMTAKTADFTSLSTDKYNYGNSNWTKVAKDAGSKATNGKLFNPTASTRQTLWLKDALSSNSAVNISVADLYETSRSGDEVVAFSSAVTYNATRYENSLTSTANAAGQAISSATSGSDSSYFTNVSFTGEVRMPYYNSTSVTSNYLRGYSTIQLRAKPNIPAGAYYYVMTVTIQLLDRSCGGLITTQQVDIVYRVDNTRPDFKEENAYIEVQSGSTATLALSSLCNDVDGNSLTISDIWVPENEFILTNQYGAGRKLPNVNGARSNYNWNVNDSITEGALDYVDSITTAQLPDSPTGFSRSLIYAATGADADGRFVTTQPNGHGNIDSAYAGYYVNAARDTLYIVGNKASRYTYRQGSTRTGDFYILVRVTDSGDATDTGIWFPVAIKVTSSPSVAAGSPEVNGAIGESFYLSPLSVYNSLQNTYIAVGAPNDRDGNLSQDARANNGNATADASRNVIPFAHDVDNYVSAMRNNSNPQRKIGNDTIDSSQEDAPATYAHTEAVFLSPGSAANIKLLAALSQQNPYLHITDPELGFKEFFTVSRVRLYASTSVLLGLTDTEIANLLASEIISVEHPNGASEAYVAFWGLKVTLLKSTNGQYLSFNVDVMDTHNLSDTAKRRGTIRIAVNVQNTTFNNTNARNDLGASPNYNKRPDEDHLSGSTYRVTGTSGGNPIFRFNTRVGREIRISPYDLFYDPDTYSVNSYVNGSWQYDTVPDGSAAHANMVSGINKNIAVYAASSASAEPTLVNNFHFKQLTIAGANQNPQVSNEYYGEVHYVAATDTVAEHFLIRANRKTPSSGYISFNYVVTTTAGDTATAEIRIYVENSLPIVRTSPKVPEVLWLSANPTLSNSSTEENRPSKNDDYFILNEATYNIREFTLSDLFTDPDGDGVLFADVISGIKVGTKDINGVFHEFADGENVYVRATIGSGSNNRMGFNNCLILEGLSSTQGVPGGVYVRFEVTDNAIGTTDSKPYDFQIEVVNSAPVYADMTDNNAMEDARVEGADQPDYVWRSEIDTMQAQYNSTDGSPLTSPTGGDLSGTVLKPLYIASSYEAMEAYKNIQQRGENTTFISLYGQNPNFSYSSAQVRFIAQDKDQAQGLSLAAANYTGQSNAVAPGFNVGTTMADSSAVLVSDFYSTNSSYYTSHKIVQLHFFTRNSAGDLVWTDDGVAANTTTEWVIAFAFTTQPTGSVDIKIRLRDSNGTVSVPADALPEGQTATAGGNTVSAKSAYSGPRTVAEGKFEPNVTISTEETFGFRIVIRSLGLYDNFSKWKSNAVVNNISINNVWTATGPEKADGSTTYYYHVDVDQTIDDTTGKELFRYEGLNVTTSGINVPLSYFAWPANNVSAPQYGAGQTAFAWYNIGKFQSATYDANGQGLPAASSTDIYGAISLSDGYQTWSGNTLNDNPYITIGRLTNVLGTQSHYLTGQQRFRVDANGTPTRIVSTQGSAFMEDLEGLSFIKKQGGVRSVGNLTLTIRMAAWTTASTNLLDGSGNIVTDSEGNPITVQRVKIDDGDGTEDKTAEIIVPLSVENTSLSISGAANEVEIDLSSDSDGHTIALTHYPDTDRNKYTPPFNLISDTGSYDHAGVVGGYTYDEEMYFLGASINGSFTPEQVAYIRGELSGSTLLDVSMRARVRAYFGVSASAGVSDIFDGNSTDGYTIKPELLAQINPKYSNYFEVSPSGADSKYVTITPKRLTTFNIDYASHPTKKAIDAAAASRGLKVAYNGTYQDSDTITEGNVAYIYYPLKLIVYDRISIGSASNSTSFTDSSFDVLSFRIRIGNSAPSVNISNFNDTVGEIPMRSVELTKGGRSITFRISDIIEDADMLLDSQKNYYTAEQIGKLTDDTQWQGVDPDDTSSNPQGYIYDAEANIKKDTADYLRTTHRVEGTGGVISQAPNGVPACGGLQAQTNTLVHVEFLSAGHGTNENAIECKVEGQTIEISVVSRVQGLSSDDVAARIRFTFTDSHGAEAVALLDVHIGNAAPTLTSQATQTGPVTMKTGQYFTLYTTPWAGFIEGKNISATVGGEDVNGYNGSYFAALKGGDADNSKNLGQKGYDSWTYGPELQNVVISGNNASGAAGARVNLGYMAIASDDAPWTLRFDPDVDGDGVVSSVGKDIIDITPLNYVPFETGSIPVTGTTPHGYTAVMIEAKAACTNATISITLTDGRAGLDDKPLSLTYTMKISVESTDPTALTDNALVGSSLIDGDYEGRVRYNSTSTSGGLRSYVYDLKMAVDEEITLRTSDFATDVDFGDTARLYLLEMSGGNLFNISDQDNPGGVPADTTKYLSITHRSSNPALTLAHTQFTVRALNFQNDVTRSEDMYATVQFYICDPNYASTDHALSIQLRVYIYPRAVAAASNNAREIAVTSLADFNRSHQLYNVNLVSMPGGGGLIEDGDADASLTAYSVNLYTLAYYRNPENEDSEIAALQVNDFLALSDKSAYLVAEFDVTDNSLDAFRSVNSNIVRQFIGDITFSSDGKTMMLQPAKATNGFNKIAGNINREGFQLYVEVTKHISRRDVSGDYGPLYTTQPARSAGATLTTRVLNSAPVEVGDTSRNNNIRDNYLPYLTVEGAKGDSWDYFVYNPYTTRDEALFSDPDGDALTYVEGSYRVVAIYTLADTEDEEGKREVFNHMSTPGVADAAASAFSIQRAETTVSGTSLPVLRFTVTNKIDIAGYSGKTVYLDIEVTARDGSATGTATTKITMGIRNSAPAFRNAYMDLLEDTPENAEENGYIQANNANAIDQKYRSEARQTSYTKDAEGNAELTVTLSMDNSESLLTANNGGVLRIPLTDLVMDNDYTSDRQNKERFSFVSPRAAAGRIDLHEISGHSAYTMWIENGESGVARTSSEQATIANKRFHVYVTDDNNSTLVIRVNSYERGASDRIVLVVQDSSGAVTGELTITLVVGNSAPIDMAGTGEANRNLILAGGREGTEGNGMFAPKEYSIRDFVHDNNPADYEVVTTEPDEPRTYLRIVDYVVQDIHFDAGSDFEGYLDENDIEAGVTEPSFLVDLIQYEQTFTIAPLPNLYGKQTIRFTVSDGGNSSNSDSAQVVITLEIQVTKNPAEMDTYSYHVYWKRTMPITARDLFDDPSTPDTDESEGLLIAGITIDNPTDKVAEEVKASGTDEWFIRGLVNNKTVNGTVDVVVGTRVSDDLERYTRPFTITVDDNIKPYFRYNDNGVLYGDGVTYIPKGYFDENGRWEVSIDTFFEDREGDDLSLKSASSNKSVLIDVTANTQTNTLVFHFKNRGETTIKVRIEDAVTTYSYTFQIGNNDLPDPNFFVGIISHIQSNPTIYLIIAAAILLLLILLIIIIAAARKKRKMRKEIEALLVSEMELEEQMLKLAAGPSSTFNYQSYGYLPPTQGAAPQPGFMLGSGQAAPAPNPNAIGLNPGNPQAQQGIAGNQQLLPPTDGMGGDDDL